MAPPSFAESSSLRGLGYQALSTLGLRGFQLGAMLLTSLGLARVLGPREFGTYSYAISWLSLLAGFGTLGFAHASVREVAQALALARYEAARSHIRTAYATAAVASVLVTAVVLLAPGLFFAAGGDMGNAAALGVAFVPLLALLLVSQGVLRGQGFAVRAQTPELLILPGLMLLGTVGLAFVSKRWQTGETALYLYGGCLLTVLSVGLGLQWRALPTELRRGSGSIDKRWLVASLPFVLVLASITISAQFDVLVVGDKLGAHATGVYALAARLSAVPAVALMVVATPLSPAIAQLFSRSEGGALQRLVEVAAIVGALGTTLIAACVIVGASWLTRIVDPGFEAGRQALFILCLGRVAEAWLGPGGTILAMTRHAWSAGVGVAAGALTSIGLSLLLVGVHGIEGAACATAASCVLRGAAMWYLVRRYEAVRASAFEALLSVARRGLAPHGDTPPAS